MQFLNTTHYLLTWRKSPHSIFFNFLAWYEVESYTGYIPRQIKLIGVVINIVVRLFLNTVSGLQITHWAYDQSDYFIDHRLFSRVSTLHHMFKLTFQGAGCTPPPPPPPTPHFLSTNHIC